VAYNCCYFKEWNFPKTRVLKARETSQRFGSNPKTARRPLCWRCGFRKQSETFGNTSTSKGAFRHWFRYFRSDVIFGRARWRTQPFIGLLMFDGRYLRIASLAVSCWRSLSATADGDVVPDLMRTGWIYNKRVPFVRLDLFYFSNSMWFCWSFKKSCELQRFLSDLKLSTNPLLIVFFSLGHFGHLAQNIMKTRRVTVFCSLAYLFGHYDRINLIFFSHFKNNSVYDETIRSMTEKGHKRSKRPKKVKKFISKTIRSMTEEGPAPLVHWLSLFNWRQ